MTTAQQRLLHITHARQDEDWVQGVLVPALGLSDEQVWTYDEADPGSLKLEELELAVKSHRYTLLVVSSAARVDQWAQFAARVAEHLGVEEDKPRLLLAALDFEPGSERARELVPLSQRCLDCFDFSNPDRTSAALARLAAQLKVAAASEPPRECPYPGLRMFGTDGPGRFHRTDLFFGRDEEGRAIVDRLRGGGHVLLVGPSGCGKSSLVRARVLPALVQGEGAMAYAAARPGAHPDAALRAALDALDPRLAPATDAYLEAADAKAARETLAEATAGPARLLFLDQLEEAFQDDADEHGARARFFARLAALGHVPGLAILLGMRADFYGDLMRSPAWDDFKDHRIELAPLRGDPLRQAITRPAEAVGVYVEPDLVERLVREADQDRAAEALPLLQVALEQLWPLREWRYLSLASYERLADGARRGLDVVLARHADACIGALPEPESVLARRVLIDLVQLGEGRPDTRRRRTACELRRAGDDERVLVRVLDHLARWRLVVIGAETTERHVDLAHDTLITGWPALTDWIAKRRDDLRTQRRLEARAAGGGLLADSELPEFTRWVARIATSEGQALGATEALLELVRRSARARRARRITFAAGVATLIVVLAVAAGVSLWQWRIALANAEEAEQQRKQADAERDKNQQLLVRSYQETGRQLLFEGRPFESIPYLVAAYRVGADNTALQVLFAAAVRHLPALSLEHQAPVESAAFSPDGTRIITVSSDHTVQIWDAATGKLLAGPLQHRGPVNSAAFSPDGTRIVTASNDKTARIWEVATGKLLAGPLEHQGSVNSAAFSPDGTRIVTASDDKTARIWDVATGKLLAGPLEHQGSVMSAAFRPDGTRVVTASADKTARVWDVATGKLLAHPFEHQGWVTSATFSPDGTRIVTASTDKTARVWDVATGGFLALEHQNTVRSASFSPDGTRVVTASRGERTAWVWDAATGKSLALEHQGYVNSAAFSPDGTRVVTTSTDKTAQVWDAATGKRLAPPLQHQAAVRSAAFSLDGTRVITASADKAARVWDAATSKPLAARLQHLGPVLNAAFSPDGTCVVTASADKTARVWDAATSKPLAARLEHLGPVLDAGFSPDSTRVVTASDKTARVWDAVTGKPLSPVLAHQDRVLSVAFSPNGTHVVTASEDHTARIWDVVAGQPLVPAPTLQHEGPVERAAFSPDGTRVVTASADKTARIWNATTGKLLAPPLEHQSRVLSAAFSPDGTRVVTAGWEERTARIWNAATGKPLPPPLQHQAAVRSAAFSPDGTRVVTASQDHTARVWDTATGKPLTPPLQHQGLVMSAMFSPDGSCVVTASDDRTARIWDAATGKPLTPPLEHPRTVESAAFSPDGTRVVTASADNTARIWEISPGRVTPADWEAVAARTPYVLENGVLLLRERPGKRGGNSAGAEFAAPPTPVVPR